MSEQTDRLVDVALLYADRTITLDLPIDHPQPRLEACRQLVVLGYEDCIAKIGPQTFRPGFHYWADFIVDESTTSFKRKNPTYWLSHDRRYHEAKSERRRAILEAGGTLGPEHDTEPLEQSYPHPHAGLKPGVSYPRWGRLPGTPEASRPSETEPLPTAEVKTG